MSIEEEKATGRGRTDEKGMPKQSLTVINSLPMIHGSRNSDDSGADGVMRMIMGWLVESTWA